MSDGVDKSRTSQWKLKLNFLNIIKLKYNLIELFASHDSEEQPDPQALRRVADDTQKAAANIDRGHQERLLRETQHGAW